MHKMLLLILLVAPAFILARAAHAQEQPAAKAPGAEKVTLQSWMKEYRRRENIAILFGNVRLSKGKLRILADAAVAWFKEDGSGVGEIYVEGNLLITDGRDVVSAEAAYYNFDTGEVTVVQAWIQTTQQSLNDLTASEWTKESGPAPRQPQGQLGIYLRARKVRTERPTRYVGEELTLSTCESPHPHWGIHTRKAVIYPGGTLEASGNKLFIGPIGIPFFGVRFEPDWRMPLHRLNVGSSSDKGDFTLSRWQLVIDRNYRLFCDLDSYQKNGFGRGVLFEYEGRASRPWLGYFEHYVVDDREAPPGVKPYRYRFKFLHMHSFSPDTGLTLEYSRTSDLDFLKQFFQREYKKGREQETYAYFRKSEDNLGLRLLVSGRTEDFRTVTQYQPQVRADAISRSLPGGFYMTGAIRNEKIVRQYAESLYLPDEEVERHDVLAKLDRPIAFGKYLNLLPSLSARYTHYNVNIADSQNVDREVVTVACSADTQFSRTYGTRSTWLNVEGLKHIVEPRIDYENTYHNDTDPARLHQFDEVDALRKGETFMFSLSNRLDTRRKVKDRQTVVNLVDWRLRIPYYPKPLRDNGGDKVGPLESRLEVAATPYLTIRSDLAYNTKRRHMAKGTANVTIRSPGTWQLYLGTVYAAGKDTIGTAGLSASLSPKWQISIRLQHNLTAGRYINKTFTLTRKFHCWIMELGLVLERDKDDPTFLFMISPAALFKKETLRFTEESIFVK